MNTKYFKSLIIMFSCALLFTSSSICFDKVVADTSVKYEQSQTSNLVKPLDVVEYPQKYLNKSITMNARFDKFAVLGLDYKTAYRSSTDYISFLIKRNDTQYNIPLSEMKLFLKRKEAEKFIDLKTDDEIQITGTVFSDALGDPWIDVNKITIIKKAANKDGEKK